MSKTIYVLSLEDEPQIAYTDFSKIRDRCSKWLDEHQNDWPVEHDFNNWVEDLSYPNTEEGEEQAWEDYKNEVVDNGTWGDYTWYEVTLD